MAKFDGILDRYSPDEQQQLIRYYDTILHSVRSRPRPPSWLDFAHPPAPHPPLVDQKRRTEKEGQKRRKARTQGPTSSRPLAARPRQRTVHPQDLPDTTVEAENHDPSTETDSGPADIEQNSIDKCRRWLMRSDFEIRQPSDL